MKFKSFNVARIYTTIANRFKQKTKASGLELHNNKNVAKVISSDRFTKNSNPTEQDTLVEKYFQALKTISEMSATTTCGLATAFEQAKQLAANTIKDKDG